jgi:RNA polymerase subunit RPABC4/transcription elongation factor Spt4
MSTEESTAQAPATRVCRTCSVEINAASASCPYCGARQFRRQPILGWRGLVVCLVAVAITVAVTWAVIRASNGGLRYGSYRSNDLTVMVPTGWSDQLLSAPHGTAIASFASSSTSADSETVSASEPVGASPNTRAHRLAAKLSGTPGVALGQIFAVVLPGGEPASELLYTEPHVDYAVIEYDACDGRIGVALTLSASRLSLLDELEEALPQAAEPICDGPDFSDRDRADTSVPLRS